MNEVELNAIFNIVPDPDKNVVDIKNRKMLIEVERIINVFSLVKAQNKEFSDAIVNYTNLDLLSCEN